MTGRNLIDALVDTFGDAVLIVIVLLLSAWVWFRVLAVAAHFGFQTVDVIMFAVVVGTGLFGALFVGMVALAAYETWRARRR